jgi:HSP20 family protein
MSGKEKKEEKKREAEIDFGLGKISLGGVFEGIGNLIDLASKLSEEAKEIKREGEIKGLGGKAKGVYGFSIRTLVGGKPVVETFGNIKREKEGPVIEEVREPIVDVVEEEDFIRVIAELPGVSKEDVKIKINVDILNLSAERGERKYAKEILLPFLVKEDPVEFSFKNGILELKLGKKES